MGRKKLSTTIYLESRHVDALHAINARTAVSRAHIIRVALDEYLHDRSGSTDVGGLDLNGYLPAELRDEAPT